jgi:hypothetical protein
MSHIHLPRLHTSRPSYYPSYSYSLFPPSLTRRDSHKRHRSITLSDDEDEGHDDYPYSANHKPARLSRASTSRAMVVRKEPSQLVVMREPPSQLERLNVWSDNRRSMDRDEDEGRRRSYDTTRRVYRYSELDGRVHSNSEDEDEREFRLKVDATFGRPNSPHPRRLSVSPLPSSRLLTEHTHTHYDTLRPNNTWVDEQWETRERSVSRERSRSQSRVRRNSLWRDVPMIEERERESEGELWRSYTRRVKRTKMDREEEEEEWRPLSGWRRRRLIVEG